MPNKYLTKIAEQIRQAKQHHPFETALKETVAGIPADAAGGFVGTKIGAKFGHPVAGALAGATLGGLATNYAVLKHQESH